jgi:hypothetical protein
MTTASKGRKKPRVSGASLFEGNADNGDVICCRCFADLDRPAQFTKSYSLTIALAPFTLRVWPTICLWAALLV